MDIHLGPILGLEGDYLHTVCFASTEKYSKQSLKLILTINEEQLECHFESCTVLESHYFYRFSFELPKKVASYTVAYHFTVDGNKLSNRHKYKSWEFEVAGQETMPKIGFCSCNGDSKKHPSKLTGKDFSMWGRMKEHHQKPDYRFNLLVMGGDQIYADSIWSKVSSLNKLKIKKIARGRKLTTEAVVNCNFSQDESDIFSKELKDFYEKLYIDSWSNRDMSYMLASVPTVMMWDDHDIVDGWGSYKPTLQRSSIFQHIFPVAKNYFEVFQTRTEYNEARVSKTHFMQHLSFRNLEIIALDNRSFRTQKQIMSKKQYNDLDKVLNKSLFQSIPKSIEEERILCFVVPVPVAHLKFSKIVQKLLPVKGRKHFTSSFNDDAIDHWDHGNHEAEQKNLLDIIFDAGEKHEAKYVCIISGDVHTAGAATITKAVGNMKITQLISSAITHVAPNRWERGAIELGTKSESDVAGYNLKLKNFGNFKKFTISDRNFGILTKASRGGIIASLLMEDRENLAHRTLNKFK